LLPTKLDLVCDLFYEGLLFLPLLVLDAKSLVLKKKKDNKVPINAQWQNTLVIKI